MNNLFEKGWLNALTRTARSNGYGGKFETAEEVFENLYYLTKEKADGTRFIPLHELRMIEKLACGLYNTAFEFDDKTDVYVEKIGNVLICYANVRYVQYGENGQKRVLGHGFNAVPLSNVSVPGEFNPTDEQRIRYWKPQAIGGAKSRALFEAGFGLEFYGDPMVLAEDAEETSAPLDPNATTHITEAIINAAEEREEKTEKKAEEATETTPAPATETASEPVTQKPAEKQIEMTQTGLPVPQPKRGRGRPKKVETPETPAAESPAAEPVKTNDTAQAKEKSEMDLGKAKEVVADIGNFAGEKLGVIYEKDPRNIIFLMRNSTVELVKQAAKAIVLSDSELAERFIA